MKYLTDINMKQKLIILVGIPASGKSTFSKEYVKENKNAVRVCRDDFRYHLTPNWVFNKANEKLISDLEMEAVFGALFLGYDVILDATNLRQDVVNNWKRLIRFLNKPIEVSAKVFDTDFTTCVQRNDKRAGNENVPFDIMVKMYEKFKTLNLEELC